MQSIFKKESKEGKSYIEGKYGVECPDVQPNDLLEGLFCIYDKVCEEYNPPFVSKNLKTAIRSLKESIKGQQSLIGMYPEDYALVLISNFDKNSGSIIPCLRQVYEISRMFVTAKDKEEVIDEV